MSNLKPQFVMRSITTFDLQYAHRFYGFQGEAQYLHGHTGKLTIEVEDSIEAGVNMVYPARDSEGSVGRAPEFRPYAGSARG